MRPCSQIKLGCAHVIRMLKTMGLEGNFEIQNKILSHFVRLIERQTKSARNYLDEIIINTDIMAVDIERFETNVTSMKQFHTKYENHIKFMSTISRYDPEACILECLKFDLHHDFRHYKGLLLNLSCCYH